MIGVLSNKLSTKFIEGLCLDYLDMSDFNPKNIINVDGLFIDWVSKVSDNEVAWMKQASLLQTYIKSGIPIVIFDREMSLTKKEVDWCKKFNVYLFEPFLNSGRNNFTYLPEWMEDDKILFNYEKEFDIVHSSYILEWELKEFEKWIRQYSKIFYDKKVSYSAVIVSDFKKEEFTRDNLIFYKWDRNSIYDKGNTTVAFDKEKMYKVGYFNPKYFYAMNCACLPLLPVEHKYFHGMFKGLTISDMKDMDYFVSTMSKVKNVVIEEIFDRIKDKWSEFTIGHAIDVIKKCYE